MIESFIASWDVFQHTYLAGWLSAVALASLGTLFVVRNELLAGAAVVQSAVLGITVGIGIEPLVAASLPAWFGLDSLHIVGGAITAACATAFMRTPASPIGSSRNRTAGGPTPEARAAWVLTTSTALPLVIVAQQPHAIAEIERLVASSIVDASAKDTFVLAGVVFLGSVLLLRNHAALRLAAIDSETAQAVGVNVRRIDAIVVAATGIVVAYSVHVAGIAYTLGCLLLPALIAKAWARRVRSMLIAAPSIALSVAVPASVVANHYAWPPGQTTSAALSLILALAWANRAVRGHRHGERDG